MSRGLGRNERAILQILARGGGQMRVIEIARVMYDTDYTQGSPYAERYDSVAISKALKTLQNKGLVRKGVGPWHFYELVRDQS